jgi:hypothetical protein
VTATLHPSPYLSIVYIFAADTKEWGTPIATPFCLISVASHLELIFFYRHYHFLPTKLHIKQVENYAKKNHKKKPVAEWLFFYISMDFVMDFVMKYCCG